MHLARGEPAAAEALLREGLRIRLLRAADWCPNRRRIFPEDDWSVGAAKSLLGAALTALARYGEAEAVLLEARRDLEALSPPPPRDVHVTIDATHRALCRVGQALTLSNIRAAEVLLPTRDLTADLTFFTETLGFRLDTYFPADDPAVATMSGHGLTIRLDRVRGRAPGCSGCCARPGGRRGPASGPHGPGGVRIQLVEAHPAW